MILFFSKMDSESTIIRSKLNQDPELKSIIQLVSVDSKPIHDILSASKNVVIDQIPCLLTINDKSISKYEGTSKINEVLTELKSKLKKEKAPALYTSLSEINFDTEEEEPNLMQEQDRGKLQDNNSPERIKITSPVFQPQTIKKK